MKHGGLLETYQAVIDENEDIRKARTDEIASWEPDARESAAAELEAYLADRVPEALKQRVHVLPSLHHVWSAFWELDDSRPVALVPVGLGGSLPIRGALPWDQVGRWLDERGITEPHERDLTRRLLRRMDAVYQKHQHQALSHGTSEESDG